MADFSDAVTSKVEKTFTDKSPEVLEILKGVGDELTVAVDAKVADALAKSGIRVKAPVANKGKRKAAHLKRIADSNGYDPVDGKRWTMDDFVDVDKTISKKIADGSFKAEEYIDTQYAKDQPLLWPRVVSMQVREAVLPEMNITPLMQVIRFTNGPILTFPAVSSMMAGNLKITEDGEYPEGKLEFAGQVTCMIGKHGIKVSMTDEMRRFSQWDVWNMNIRAAGRALGRHKELQAIEQVLSQGSIFIDNTDSSARHTTGRDTTGAYNGTLTVWDLYETCADLIQDGYNPDLIIMHPFAWPVFANDPVMRTMAFMAGRSTLGGYSGSPGNGEMFNLGGLNGQRTLAENANLATTFAPVPSAMPFGPMRVVISAYVDYDRTAHTTTIFVADSRDLGLLVVDEDIVTEEWRTPEHDTTSIKFRERYSFATANNGRAIRQIKGVVVARAYHFEGGMLTAQVTLATSEAGISSSW